MAERSIFVFGSNTSGRHGKGAALYALKNHGAVYGQGTGRQGNSYAIPTKDASLRPLTVAQIRRNVAQFIVYAERHKEEQFMVTAVGTGLAGYSHEQIAPMFKEAPPNCTLPPEWLSYVGKKSKEDI